MEILENPGKGPKEARKRQEEARRGKGQESRIWRKTARNAMFYEQKMTSLRGPSILEILESSRKRPEEARKRPEQARKRAGKEEARKGQEEARKRPEEARRGAEEARKMKRPGRGQKRPEEARKRLEEARKEKARFRGLPLGPAREARVPWICQPGALDPLWAAKGTESRQKRE